MARKSEKIPQELGLEAERVQRAGRAIMRALRDDAGLTRKEMAHRLGTSIEAVRDLETGRRRIGLDDPAVWALVTNSEPVRVLQQIFSWKELGVRRGR